MRVPAIDRAWSVRLGIGAAALVGAWLLFVGLPGWYSGDESGATPGVQGDASTTGPAASGGRTIKGTIFAGSEDGMRLVGVEREVPFDAATVEQARQILLAQLEPVEPPYVSVIPEGTRLRALYLTDRGEAFVDLSREVTSAHPGGSLAELYTVYAIVNAITVNLPAVSGVQILVEGHEVDTLAGHVDLRHPLQQSSKWVEEPATAVAAAR